MVAVAVAVVGVKEPGAHSSTPSSHVVSLPPPPPLLLLLQTWSRSHRANMMNGKGILPYEDWAEDCTGRSKTGGPLGGAGFVTETILASDDR